MPVLCFTVVLYKTSGFRRVLRFPKPNQESRGCQVCENAQKPSGFLMVKIGELERLGFKVSGFKLRAVFGIEE